MSELIPLFISTTGLNERDIRKIIANAPRRYKIYSIPKRMGGTRTIAQPARELKLLQRILVSRIIGKLPVHKAATAYKARSSIKSNAEAHAHNGPILKFDFQNFFPSIVANDWRTYCAENEIFKYGEDIDISTQILFWKESKGGPLRLAIGAPSSPCLSNILMYKFDSLISEFAEAEQVTYTRYADDLTFSAKRTGYLTGIEKMLRRTMKEVRYPSLTINASKTKLATKKYKRFITGLILSNDGQISIGHEKKRNIRAAVHHATLGKLNAQELAQLAGLLAHVHNVEPEFIQRLSEKFGEETITRIRATKIVSRRYGE